jgi:hypothetical protein
MAESLLPIQSLYCLPSGDKGIAGLRLGRPGWERYMLHLITNENAPEMG